MASERFQRQIDQQLGEAEAALSRYDWEAALLVLAIAPDNADAQTFLATVERALSGLTAPPPTSQPEPPTPTTIPVATPTQPTSFANGRCQVKWFLGEGSKKKVYLAHDPTLDCEVAFTLI